METKTSFIEKFSFSMEAVGEKSPFKKLLADFAKSSDYIMKEFKDSSKGKKYKDLDEDAKKVADNLLRTYNSNVNKITDSLSKMYDNILKDNPKANIKQEYVEAVAEKARRIKADLGSIGLTPTELEHMFDEKKKENKWAKAKRILIGESSNEDDYDKIVADIFEAFEEDRITEEEASILLEEVCKANEK